MLKKFIYSRSLSPTTTTPLVVTTSTDLTPQAARAGPLGRWASTERAVTETAEESRPFLRQGDMIEDAVRGEQ